MVLCVNQLGNVLVCPGPVWPTRRAEVRCWGAWGAAAGKAGKAGTAGGAGAALGPGAPPGGGGGAAPVFPSRRPNTDGTPHIEFQSQSLLNQL